MSTVFQWNKNTPCKANGDDGDSLLWAGLLYATSGKAEYRAGMVSSMDADGRFWRSPARVGVDKENSFSRDMATGLLLGAAFDKANGSEFGINGYYLERWISYIKATGKLCPDATDNRSVVTTTLWWKIAYVRPDLTPWYYRYTRYLLKPWQYISSEVTPSGYQSHLTAATILMLYVLAGKRSTSGWLKAASDKLSEREPRNAFFAWLNLENDVALQLLKAEEALHPLSLSNGTQWTWERTDDEEAGKNSCGHDRAFIEYLLNGDIN